MRPERKLTLKRETLVELRTDALRDVAAGATPNCQTNDCGTSWCITRNYRCEVSQFIDPCLTGLTCVCA